MCAQSGAVCALVAHAISLTPHYFLVGGKGYKPRLTAHTKPLRSLETPHGAARTSLKTSSATTARRNRAVSPLVPGIDGAQPRD